MRKVIFRISILFVCGLVPAAEGFGSAPGITVPDMPSEGYISAVDGARLYYQKVGASDKVIILPLRLFAFRDFSQLADEYTVIAYDPRNRGRSSSIADAPQLGLQHDVEDIEIVRKHFGLEKINLVGYSYMGKVIILYALKYPKNVARLIQIGPVPIKLGTQYPKHLTATDEAPVIDAASRAKWDEMRKNGLDKSKPAEFCEFEWSLTKYLLVSDPKNADRLGPSPCEMPNEYPVNLDRHIDALLRSDRGIDIPKTQIAKLSVPVLTIHGTRDRNAPYGAGREWASILPNAKLLTIKGGAHQVFSEYSGSVFPAIRLFLAGKNAPEFEIVRSVDGAN